MISPPLTTPSGTTAPENTQGLGRFRRCGSMFEPRSVAWTKSRLREQFEPFGARVWRLSGDRA